MIVRLKWPAGVILTAWLISLARSLPLEDLSTSTDLSTNPDTNSSVVKGPSLTAESVRANLDEIEKEYISKKLGLYQQVQTLLKDQSEDLKKLREELKSLKRLKARENQSSYYSQLEGYLRSVLKDSSDSKILLYIKYFRR